MNFLLELFVDHKKNLVLLAPHYIVSHILRKNRSNSLRIFFDYMNLNKAKLYSKNENWSLLSVENQDRTVIETNYEMNLSHVNRTLIIILNWVHNLDFFS